MSFYGHKMPVLSCDISSDNTLLVSGSADKYIKIWGMDFGDCHKSLLAHKEPVTQVKFVRDTHYIISTGRDGMVKYWDGDTKVLVHEIDAHIGDIWTLGMSSIGDYFVTAGSDKILRLFKQTRDLVYPQVEEQDKNQKKVIESYLDDTKANADTATLGKRGIDSLRNGEDIIEAILKAEKLKEDFMDYEEEILSWESKGKSG